MAPASIIARDSADLFYSFTLNKAPPMGRAQRPCYFRPVSGWPRGARMEHRVHGENNP